MEERDVRYIRSLASHNGDRVGIAMQRNIAASLKPDNAGPKCLICRDTGWKPVQSGSDVRVARCDCSAVSRTQRLIEQAHFPPRYQNCDLAGYETESIQGSVVAAKMAAEKFIANYPLEKIGLLLIGPSGAGKTHLSVAILRQLIVLKGIACLFCDYRELLKQIQNSYNASVQVTELELLRPVFQTEVLVLDDLGAVKPSEWVFDTVSVILNTRYNENRTTIITSNFVDGPAAAVSGPRRAAREETLGDRIGERMRSRLFEMCRLVTVSAPDYRQKFRSAR